MNTFFTPAFRRHATRAVVALLASLSVSACGGGSAAAEAALPSPMPAQQVAPLPTPDVSAVAVAAAASTTSTLPTGWQRGAFMQIFVRSYRDSNGDGVGDLRGVVEKLDHLKALGVTGLWLMPINPSQDGDHGYAVTDYRGVETAYGSLADFDLLLAQAHARGMGVILDYVINHSAATHPLFVNARASASNPFRDWYLWQPVAPLGWSIWGSNPWRMADSGSYYAPFWEQMPDFNLNHEPVLEFHRHNLRWWLNRGVDGFRFDAVGSLVENGPNAWQNQPRNYTLMAEMKGLVAQYHNRYVVCESPDDSRGFASACGNAFAFDLSGLLIDAAKGDTAAVARAAAYFNTAPSGMATMLSNHDAFAGQRVWDQLGGQVAAYKLAAASLLLLPGTPFIYYGEEVGMAGAAVLGGDPKLRSPMSWTANTTNAGFTTGQPYRELAANVATQNVAAQQGDAQSLLAHYKALLALRSSRASLTQGRYEAAFASGAVWGFQRVLGEQRTLVVFNAASSAMADVPVAGLPANAVLRRLLDSNNAGAGNAVADASGTLRLSLPAQSVTVFGLN